MVQIVSMSSVSPAVRRQHKTRQDANDRRYQGGEQEAGNGLSPQAMIGQHADGIGAGTEERRVAERDNAGVAEREIERQREQNGDQQFGAEAEIAWENEIAADCDEPGKELPPAKPVARDQRARRRMIGARVTAACGVGAAAKLMFPSFQTAPAAATAAAEL